ncbi:hypothetical protein MHLP_02940 [Candidatus Mycoplasma haematolamae str. Purdue]|uniref:Uncharacterized protein n=1 Tax=Mycoplasma haematolamae (strain Purdue) TaxID=1212765 RepID=I7BJX4_MYCHA|nr:hypothetical protein [Candidatus Mycoplasma haematolamae]AFO52168.1 hypothetical protein MHLP_02940 [Candidatus Mycoplasma haematolamae str. Purdue]
MFSKSAAVWLLGIGAAGGIGGTIYYVTNLGPNTVMSDQPAKEESSQRSEKGKAANYKLTLTNGSRKKTVTLQCGRNSRFFVTLKSQNVGTDQAWLLCDYQNAQPENKWEILLGKEKALISCSHVSDEESRQNFECEITGINISYSGSGTESESFLIGFR